MDQVFERFLCRQYEEGVALSEASDLVALRPVRTGPTPVPRRYVAYFSCIGLVRQDDGSIVESSPFAVGIDFHDDYLRTADPFRAVAWLGPANVWHPNISDRAPFICLGHLTPGTPLVDLIFQCFEIITYQKVTMREDDCLNRAACAWARQNRDRLPIDPRALKRRPFDFVVEPIPGGSAS